VYSSLVIFPSKFLSAQSSTFLLKAGVLFFFFCLDKIRETVSDVCILFACTCSFFPVELLVCLIFLSFLKTIKVNGQNRLAVYSRPYEHI
jgi:uncharacterized membrane protein